MSAEAEILDPRFDSEPRYWTELRERAGLRADWAWEVLVTQAWCARTPQLYTVFHDDNGPCGVVAAAWVGPTTRRNRFVAAPRRGRVGILDVRAPGSSAVPGWWFADGAGASRIVGDYARVMRKHLGIGLRGMLVRQVGEPECAAVDSRFRLLRKTENIGMLDVRGMTEPTQWTSRLSKSRRGDVRNIRNRFARDAGIEGRIVPGKDLDPVEVATVLRDNYDKHRDVPILPLPAFVSYLKVLLAQPDVLGSAYFEQPSDRLVALTLLLDHAEWPICRSWGSYPVGRGGRSNLYFYNVARMADWSIESGKDGLVLGKKMSDVKKAFGIDPLPQYALALPLGL